MPNWGQAASGAASGAAAGSAVLPGWGTAIGAVAGGLSGLFGGKQKDKFRQLTNLSPEQQQFQNMLLQNLQGGQAGQNYGGANDYISQMLSGSPEAYQRFAQPHITQFNEQVLPGIAERFAGLGGGLGGGATSSSGFGQALGGAATQFQSNLAGLYAQLQQQAANQAFNQYNTMGNLGLGTRGFENLYQPGQLGAGGQFMAGLGENAGKGIGLGISQRIASAFQNKFGQNQQPQEDINDFTGYY